MNSIQATESQCQRRLGLGLGLSFCLTAASVSVAGGACKGPSTRKMFNNFDLDDI